jgi:hypothetical protein
MAIDESAGVLARRDRVLKSSAQSYAMAVLAHKGPSNPSVSIRTLNGLAHRGLITKRLHPEVGPWFTKWHLTDSGRKVAEESPAVKEWRDAWGTSGYYPID